MSYIDYLEMLGDDVSKMRAADHIDFKTDEAFGTVFMMEKRPILAYIYTWAGPGPEELLEGWGFKVSQVVPRGNGHFTCALSA